MPELVLPTTYLHTAFLECRDDWGPGLHEDGVGLGDEDDVDSSDGFAAWVHQRVRLTHPAGTPCPDERRGARVTGTRLSCSSSTKCSDATAR